MKESCEISWILQDEIIEPFKCLSGLLRQGKNDPEGNSEIIKAAVLVFKRGRW